MKRYLLDVPMDEPRSSRKWLIATAIVVALVAIAMAGRLYVAQRVESALIAPGAASEATSADVGLPVSSFTITSGDRALRAWFMRATDSLPGTPAVLIFHGNRTSVAHHVGVFETLFANGITAMVFDYSGFGVSTGEPTAKNLREDAVAAFGAFADSAGPISRKYVLGTSLGAAVVLDAVTEFANDLDGVILVGAFASARDIAIRTTPFPRALAMFLPDLFNNIKAAQNLTQPLLVIHSAQDELFPLSDAEAIVGAAAGPARLVTLEGVEHGAYLTSEEQWEPVISFMTPQRIP